jgi:hypothetical protein
MPKIIPRTKGPSHPQKKPNGFFEAITWMPHKEKYLRTFHETRKKAQRRLDGNPRHSQHRIIDHTPREETKPPVPEKKPKKVKASA